MYPPAAAAGGCNAERMPRRGGPGQCRMDGLRAGRRVDDGLEVGLEGRAADEEAVDVRARAEVLRVGGLDGAAVDNARGAADARAKVRREPAADVRVRVLRLQPARIGPRAVESGACACSAMDSVSYARARAQCGS